MRIRLSNSAVKGLAVILTIACIGGGTAYAGSVVSKNNLIGEDAAKEFAILDADVTWNDVSDLYTHLERDRGSYVYDIEFRAGSTRYEYEIRADDGSVLEKDVKNEKETTPAANTDIQQENETSAKETGKEPKKSLETPADHTSGKTADQTEVPAEQPVTQQEVSRNGYLSVDEAKKIALDHAGLTEDQVRFSTAKFDDDDSEGEEYEIEFYIGNTEFEYEIDARTGEIRDHSKEIDDDDD